MIKRHSITSFLSFDDGLSKPKRCNVIFVSYQILHFGLLCFSIFPQIVGFFTLFTSVYIYIYKRERERERDDLHMTPNLSIAVYAFPVPILTLFSVNETLLPRYVGTCLLILRFAILCGDCSILIETHELCFNRVHVKVNASCCLLQ